MSMTERLERAIAKKPLSINQIKARFPTIKNVYACIHDMRRKGYDVKSSGRNPVSYSL
jgi:hypothetical protein